MRLFSLLLIASLIAPGPATLARLWNGSAPTCRCGPSSAESSCCVDPQQVEFSCCEAPAPSRACVSAACACGCSHGSSTTTGAPRRLVAIPGVSYDFLPFANSGRRQVLPTSVLEDQTSLIPDPPPPRSLI